MKTYHGSCHCKKIKFKVTTNLDKVVSCNCSICTKKGVLHHRVTPEQFTLLEGKEYLSLYQFDSKEAKHYFCKQCGIHPFSNPRAAPDMYSINVRCLDDFDLEKESYKIIKFDGQNWEEAVLKLNQQYNE
ncbi:GFA family protein [Candidatus Marithrix sp. Canyon 246]|uniref:GFA family protein n=1 Tax=Candidatus Marithrix sp. Canyon 246 TaxID=1827136 RepID=UPI00084A178E|nr:GFA family protein [Candidatus Marithrix sp. Canyon 246]